MYSGDENSINYKTEIVISDLFEIYNFDDIASCVDLLCTPDLLRSENLLFSNRALLCEG